MSRLENKKLINSRVEFYDKELEDSYYEQQIASYKGYIRHIILGVGIIYLVFSFINAEKLAGSLFWQVLAVRSVVFALALASWFIIKKTRVVTVACACITFFPPVLCFAHIAVCALMGNQYFAYQAMLVMLIIFFTTLMPNRWINLVFIDVLMAGGFLIFAPMYIQNIATNDYVIVLLFLLVTLLFAVAAQYRSNLNQREKFLRERHLESQTVTDKLTGLYNRLWFDLTLGDWCVNTEKDQVFSLVLMDIDDFKLVNDTYGHLIGDGVLQECAQLLKNSVRTSDLLARWGGEEFTLLLPGANIEKAVELAERMRQNIEKHEFKDVGKITCSFGVTTHMEGQTAESMLHEVDKQLYTSKALGKNCISFSKN